MSGSIYNDTLNCFVNVIKTTATSNKGLYSGLLTVGTNTVNTIETQIAPSGTYTGIAASQVLIVMCDNPLSITFNNGSSAFTTLINSFLVLPGTVSSFTLTNNNAVTVNAQIVVV